MRAGFVVRRMTGCTVRCERREGPGDDLRVIRVAVRAAQVKAMITGISCRLMSENQRRPGVSAVTMIAFQLRGEVID